MKFLCDNCQAKYRIADEKVAGRTLRMRCRKCGHEIKLHGQRGLPSSRPPPAPEGQAAGSGGAAPGPPSQGTGSAPAPASPSGGPRAPAPQAGPPSQAGQAGPSGASQPGQMGPSGATPHSGPPAHAPLGAGLQRQMAEGPRGAAPGAAAPSGRIWWVGIRDVPVGPLGHSELQSKVGSGAVTGDSLVWREGFDDWRRLREVPELRSLVGPARRSSPPPPPPPTPPPAGAAVQGRRGSGALPHAGDADAARAKSDAASSPGSAAGSAASPSSASSPGSAPAPQGRSNVVPIGGRGGASPAPAADKRDSGAAGAPASAKDTSAQPAPPSGAGQWNEPAAEPLGASPERAASSSGAPATASGRPATAAATASASAPGVDIDVDQALPQVPDTQAAQKPTPVPAPAPEELRGSGARTAPRRPGGLPMGAWIMMAGVAVLGVAVGMVVSTMVGPKEQPVAAANSPAPKGTGTSGTPTDTEGQASDEGPKEPDLVLEAEADAGAPEAEANAEKDERQKGDQGSRGTGSARKRGRGDDDGKDLTEEQRKRLAQFADDSTGAADIDVGGGSAGGGGANAQGLNARQLGQVVSKNRSALRRCYEHAIRGMGSPPTARMDVRIKVGMSGKVMRVKVSGSGTSIGNLRGCIESTVERWTFPRAGKSTETTFPVVFQPGG